MNFWSKKKPIVDSAPSPPPRSSQKAVVGNVKSKTSVIQLPTTESNSTDSVNSSQKSVEPQLFKPPERFVKASQARQEKIKVIQRTFRDETEPTSNNVSPVVSPKPTEVKSLSKEASAASITPQKETPINNIKRNSVPKTSSTPSSPAPQKTHQGIQQIQNAREERRRVQAQVKEFKDSLETGDGEQMISSNLPAFRYLIEKFKNERLPAGSNHGGHEETLRDVQSKVIRVCVRKRPLSDDEKQQFLDVVSTTNSPDTTPVLTGPDALLYIHEPKYRVDLTRCIDTHSFNFDHVFDTSCDNEQIFKVLMPPLIDVMFRPTGRSTFFAYGQTGSGKSFTVFGHKRGVRVLGLFDYLCGTILNKLQRKNAMLKRENVKPLRLTLRFFEMYAGRIYDLFNRRGKVNILESKDGQVQIVGLKEVPVTSIEEMQSWMDVGEKSRSTGATEANPHSSRSHAILQYSLYDDRDSLQGQFSLIDLAGSERASEANSSDKQTRLEGGEINKSLLALKECIRALNDPKATHVPFRASKLTQILRDSLQTGRKSDAPLPPIGKHANNNSTLLDKNRAVVMMANISPSSDHVGHSLNTVRYADRVMDFKGSISSGEKSAGTLIFNPLELMNETVKDSEPLARNDELNDPEPIVSRNDESQQQFNDDETLKDEIMDMHIASLRECLQISSKEEEYMQLIETDWLKYLELSKDAVTKKLRSYEKLLAKLSEVSK